MSRTTRYRILPTGALVGLLWGAIIVPAVLSLAVGIVALALWREAVDVVLGVLVLSFAAMAIAGAVLAMAFLRRSARLAELQSDFVAAVSHELKTPLAGIRLMAETLALGRAQDPAVAQEVFSRLTTEVDRLENLVDRVLDWRRLEAGHDVLTLEPLAIAEVLQEAVTPLVLGSHATPLALDIAADLPPLIGDRTALVSAFRNVIDNAVKFAGPQGPVTISAARGAEEIVVAVSDHGPGIPATVRKRIFERFYRMPGQGHGGTGLGLAIVRHVIAGHRGRVAVQSIPGNGTTFHIHLPLPEPRRKNDADNEGKDPRH